ncbi:MAG TPA: hypothetical protein VG672_05120, partial [Bryobacteraceae bacterium]|nr:hypothetical protein [Bryobacteraceae bacterium]
MTDIAQPYSDDLREFYFSNPQEKVSIQTIEFRHSSFVDADGNPAAARFCNADQPGDDFQGTLEDSAPLNAGETVTFVAARFDITLPESNS